MTATHTIPTNRDRVIHSRDILARIEELRAERDSCTMLREDGTEEADPQGWADFYREDAAELATLTGILDYAGYDWARGVILVRADYFTAYARGMLCASGAVLATLPDWVTIDWEATATDFRLRHALPAIDFGGVTYWPDDQTRPIWEADHAA